MDRPAFDPANLVVEERAHKLTYPRHQELHFDDKRAQFVDRNVDAPKVQATICVARSAHCQFIRHWPVRKAIQVDGQQSRAKNILVELGEQQLPNCSRVGGGVEGWEHDITLPARAHLGEGNVGDSSQVNLSHVTLDQRSQLSHDRTMARGLLTERVRHKYVT